MLKLFPETSRGWLYSASCPPRTSHTPLDPLKPIINSLGQLNSTESGILSNVTRSSICNRILSKTLEENSSDLVFIRS